MKRSLIFTLAILSAVSAAAQNRTDSIKVKFVAIPPPQGSIVKPSVVDGVCRHMVICLRSMGYLFAADDDTFNRLLDIKDKNGRFAFEEFSLHSVISGLYELRSEETSEREAVFKLTNTNLKEESSPFYSSRTFSMDLVVKDDVQKYAAYDIVNQCIGLNGEGKRELDRLEKRVKEIQDEIDRRRNGIIASRKQEERAYILRSFLPPINQFQSHTQKGKNNGIAILTLYGASVGSFIYFTTSYNSNKRKYDGVTIDLTESAKAKDHYQKQMDLCRAGQIASGILFAGTYVYGVANALANRGAYMGFRADSGMIIAPTAYGNGAGLALVYRF